MNDLISPNLKLPYLAPAQAKKHVTHNEALRQLDTLVQLSVTSIRDTLLEAPENGQCLIIGENPDGDLEGKENFIAAYQDGTWIYYAPRRGWRAYAEQEAELYVYDGNNWVSMSSSGDVESANVLGINAAADLTNRLSVKSPASLFDHEGEGHHLKINKSASQETASFLLQTQYQSKAEIGLTGDDKLHIKVSADGVNFKDSLIIDPETGNLSMPLGANKDKMGDSVEDSGGAEYHYGIPSVSVLYHGRQNLTLVKSRMYFCPVYIDRPTKIAGGFIAQPSASSTPGAIIRAGIYKLGGPNGNDWQIGERLADLGALPADSAGHKDFDLMEPVILQAGWYAFAVGTNGSGVVVRTIRTYQSGQSFVVKTSVGALSDIRFSGPANYLYANAANDEIETGLSDIWPVSPVIDLLTTQPYGHLQLIPKWEKWA